MGERQRPLIDNHTLCAPHSTLGGPWELLPLPLPSTSRYLDRNTRFASYRAISLVSCRAVAILSKPRSRGIPPSLISKGQYLSATRQEQVAEHGWPSTRLCPDTHCAATTALSGCLREGHHWKQGQAHPFPRSTWMGTWASLGRDTSLLWSNAVTVSPEFVLWKTSS